MPDFLTVKEAALATGKSTSSIRRIIYPIVKNDEHPDRHHVRPSPDEARELRLKGENFPWQLSQELLDREVTSKQPADGGEARGAVGDDASLRELNAFLREQLQQSQVQLQVKDQQIATFMDLTKGLHERLREGNVLIGTLQRQLAIAEPSANAQPPKPDKKTPAPAAPPKPRPPKQPEIKKPEPKRGLWRRMFG